MRRNSKVNLYWVSTRDHDEDWFIFAKTARSAEKYHEDYEGYDPRDATAEQILQLEPGKVSGSIPRHAQIEDLVRLGFEVLNSDPNGRSARLNDRTFVEGYLESLAAEVSDNLCEQHGKGRPAGTKRRVMN